MNYKQMYNEVIASGKFLGRKAKINELAQLVFSSHYNGVETKEEATYVALELYDEMTGNYMDPTEEEFEDIVFHII